MATQSIEPRTERGETPLAREDALGDRSFMPSPITSSLLGLAAGDCLGAAVENWSPGRIAQRHPGGVRDFQFAAPFWTDDTQQALVLLDSVLRHGRLDPAWIGERFVEMSWPRAEGEFGCHRGYGPGFRAAVIAFEQDRDWRTSGGPDRPGNGAAMRIAPAAVALCWRANGASPAGSAAIPALDSESEAFSRAIVEASLVTHRESRALAGALAVARLAVQLAGEGVFPLARARARDLLCALAGWLREREIWLAEAYPETAPFAGERHDVSDLLARLVDRLGGGWDACATEIVQQARVRLGTPPLATDGYVLCSVVTAIALVLLAEDSFEEMLVRAVGLGGDTDTTAAMAGGIAGAAAGVEAIPERWQRFAGADLLARRAEAVAMHLRQPGSVDLAALPDVVAFERAVSATLSTRRV